ncbi:leukemia-associated protein 7 [Alligator sinensis]|uniref:Leukemia-associated protein 7 n=1 Tax=Alligator sinensis TaxID=38654 RepID=A0A3Q0GXR5_ALLSI|nr:leukemia-associated protein 7 [Alligator sinensis]
MAKPTPLLVSINHQLVALQTLQLLQQERGGKDDTSAHLDQASQAPLFSIDRPSPIQYGMGQDQEAAFTNTSCQVGKQAGSRKGTNQSPEEEEENGFEPLQPQPKDSFPLCPPRPRTLTEIALHSMLSRVVDLTSQLVNVEQTLLFPLLQEHHSSDHLKDSIEFRNICSHMASQGQGWQFDRDLYAAYECLKTIVKKLICSLAVFPSESYAIAQSSLRQILQNLPEMRETRSYR